MKITERIENALKKYQQDNFSQNDLINDIGVSRSLFFDLKKIPNYEDSLKPATKRKILLSLGQIGF